MLDLNDSRAKYQNSQQNERDSLTDKKGEDLGSFADLVLVPLPLWVAHATAMKPRLAPSPPVLISIANCRDLREKCTVIVRLLFHWSDVKRSVTMSNL